VIRREGEQIDAVFEWRGRQFLMEAKAKRETIDRGSHDWEDFELKVRKREGGVVGLYCSLGAVAESVMEAATQLNRSGSPTIVLSGDLWDDLHENAFPLSDVLRYMLLHVRADFKATPPPIDRVRNWLYERDSTIATVEGICQRQSALYLRRHKLDRHRELYVEREIDRDLIRAVESLRPSSLSRLSKRKTRKDGDGFVVQRDIPPQISIVRDASGAGKTTLAVQLALGGQTHFAVVHAALEPEIDRLDVLLDSVGPDHGLQSLVAADRPLMLVIDSLDEARAIPTKHQEVLSLLKTLDDLNRSTDNASLLCFPVMLVFTVREDYWERWATLFEGRNTVSFRKHFSRFSKAQMPNALEKYYTVYDYRLVSPPSQDAQDILAVPFNLQVFSEANKHFGSVSAVESLPQNVLSLYFARKREDVLRRGVHGLGSATFMLVCASLGMLAARNGNDLQRLAVLDTIRDVAPLLEAVAEDVILALLSDQILVRNTEAATSFRVRHSRFVEYLAAYYVVHTFSRSGDTARVDALTDELFASPVVSMFRVHECVRFIAGSEFPAAAEPLIAYYATSNKYMSSNLGRLRAEIAYGGATSAADLALIFRATADQSPQVTWDVLFVLAAKTNGQSLERIVDAFVIAWARNAARADRWKLLAKIGERGAILNERIVKSVVESAVPREWEVFLGYVLDLPDREWFATWWCDAGGADVEALPRDAEWEHVRLLLSVARENRPYVKGDI
jgi:hypothetical protein